VAQSGVEQALTDLLRSDARVACAPRRADLPPGAVAGIECHPDVLYVDRVGVYRFDDPGAMLDVYTQRMQEYGVDPDSGSCLGGTSGETGWGPSFRPDDPEMPWARSGCYLDESNIANVRLTCDDMTYVGILGRNADMRALFTWAWKSEDGTLDYFASAPGICLYGVDIY
jgi:hypothetical protein